MVNRCGLIVLLALSFAPAILAQPCPMISVTCPDSGYETSLTFNANVSGSVNPSFHWTVSAGRITTGQGTSSITVTGPFDGHSPTATVEVGGIPNGCPNQASCSIIFEHFPKARKFDEYGAEVIPLSSRSHQQTHQRRRRKTKRLNPISNR
jgi:hypothetical protein